jgi:hypothetical protein
MSPRLFNLAPLCLLLAPACAGPARTAPGPDAPEVAPAVVAAPSAVPRRFTVIGLVTDIRDINLARRVALGRAMQRVCLLESTEALGVTLEAAGGESRLLTTSGNAISTPLEVTYEAVGTGWLARVTAERSPETLAEMEKLEPVEAVVTVRHPDAAIALQYAEWRAIRQVMARSLPPSGEGVLDGRLTLISLEQIPAAGAATVRLRAHLHLRHTAAVGDTRRRLIFNQAADEHGDLGELPEAVAALEKLAALDTGTAGPWARLGEAYLLARDPARAAAAFEKAFQIEPSNLAHLKREIEALRAIPDEKTAREVEIRLRQAEDQAFRTR